MLTIKAKIIVIISFVVGLLFSGFGLFIYQQVKVADIDKFDVRLDGLSDKLRDEIDEQFENHRFPEIKELQHISAKKLPLSIARIFDSSGITIYADSMLLAAKVYAAEEIMARKPLIENISIHQVSYRSLWRKVKIENNYNLVLQVAAPLSEVEANLEQLKLILWTGIPFVLLLSAFAVYLIVRSAFRPLTAIIETANRISASNLNERLTLPQSHDEVAVLGAAMNRMIERLEAAFKGQRQFVADASHELRTPLAIIQSELEFAERSHMPDPAQKSIHLALDELDHLRKVASDLLLLAKLENENYPLRFQSVRLDELVADCVQKMTRIAGGKKIAVQLEVEDVVELSADEETIRSALLNLIDNAFKYTPDGGDVNIIVKRKGGNGHIVIQDNGIGISKTDLPNIFKPFYRSDLSRATHSGSGLGLSISKRIVELHQGTVSLESEPNHGSTFIITIPMIQKSALH